MAHEISWERADYASRVDEAAGRVGAFVEAELRTIDADAARASPQRWAIVCRFFAGAAMAARAQGRTPMGGGREMASYLSERFPNQEGGAGLTAGFEDFMDWLSNPGDFHPTGLRKWVPS